MKSGKLGLWTPSQTIIPKVARLGAVIAPLVQAVRDAGQQGFIQLDFEFVLAPHQGAPGGLMSTQATGRASRLCRGRGRFADLFIGGCGLGAEISYGRGSRSIFHIRGAKINKNSRSVLKASLCFAFFFG